MSESKTKLSKPKTGGAKAKAAIPKAKAKGATKSVPKTVIKVVAKTATKTATKTASKDSTSSSNEPIKNNKKALKDLDSIISDPIKYANSVTVDRLVTILKKMSEYYYTQNEPLVDDDTFDLMVDVLKERDPNNEFLFQTGAPSASRDDVELPFGMPSLNKIKPGEKSLTKYFKEYTGPYVVSDKLDGISAQLYKDVNGEIDLFSKTQTRVGKSKKHLIQYLVKQKVLDALPNDTSVRGEILISREDFKEFADKFKNPRNTMAGLVNTDKVDTRLAKKAQFVLYSVIQPRMTYSEQMRKLEEWGFKTVWHRELSFKDLDTTAYDEDPDNKYSNQDEEDVEMDEMDKYKKMENKLEQILKYRRAESEFDCDGIVVADDSKTYLYDNDSNPAYAMAFKKNIQTDMREVKVVEVMWDPSMYFVLKPVLRVEPVQISGVTITNVTAHNAAYVYDNKIGAGSIVKISRSGDVIPYIEEVIKSNKKADMPDMKYEWNETKVDIYVVDPDEETLSKINIKRNLHFFRTLGVKFLSEGIMTLLYNAGYTTVLSVLVAASDRDEEPSNISGLGKRMIEKIYNEIDRVLKTPSFLLTLPKIMSGSLMFGMGMGERKIKELLKSIPDLLTKYDDASQTKIKNAVLEVPGFSDISATKIADNLKKFNNFLSEIRVNTNYDLTFSQPVKATAAKAKGAKAKATKATKATKSSKSDDGEKSNDEVDFSNEKVVLTGTRDPRIVEFIEANGGKVASSVSGNTTLVIYVPTPKGKSAKLQDAENRGIKLIAAADFLAQYNL